ncbi:MAG: HAMP domain-containing sensor histidine kinase [Acidimicrobiales bacterium]
MRRRLGIALIGLVTASLLLAGLGAILLASVTDRQNDEADLREQTDALRGLLAEVTLVGSGSATETRLEQVRRLSTTMSLEGIGIVFVPANGPSLGSFPAGIEVADLDMDLIRAGGVDSGHKDGLVFAAGGTNNRLGGQTLLVLTRQPNPVIQPAFRWFLVAGLATILVAVLVTVRLSRRLIEPIVETSDAAMRIAGGDMTARVDDRYAQMGGELADLVGSVNRMAGSLERGRALERQFLLSVSHDLRTPLTSIRGYAEALTDGATDDPVAVGRIIETESRRLERLVGDLLLLARLEGTDFAYNLADHDLGVIVDDNIDGLRQEAVERGVELRVRRPDTAMRARVDVDRFGQVVANLVGNAIRFADREVLITLWAAEGRIHLAVADDGPGISDADLPHVFERLYVAQHNPKVQESGSGLGLAIVRELTEGMGGSVIARRATGGGAELVVSFDPSRV